MNHYDFSCPFILTDMIGYNKYNSTCYIVEINTCMLSDSETDLSLTIDLL